MDHANQNHRERSTSAFTPTKLIVLMVVVATAVTVWFIFRDELTLESLAARERQFREFQTQRPLLTYVLAFAVYVLVTGVSLPGAWIMSPLYAWLFGFWQALVLVSFASTTGATMAFLLSRFLLRDVIQANFGDRLAGFNRALAREGAYYLFTLRLIVAVPFWMINLVMGLTPIRTRTFWWVSQLGMLPATVVYVWAGSTVPSLETLTKQGVSSLVRTDLLVALAILGLFPLAIKKLVSVVRSRREAAA